MEKISHVRRLKMVIFCEYFCKKSNYLTIHFLYYIIKQAWLFDQFFKWYIIKQAHSNNWPY